VPLVRGCDALPHLVRCLASQIVFAVGGCQVWVLRVDALHGAPAQWFAQWAWAGARAVATPIERESAP
jgi:uncharacterized RDD family membrane protein YckC